MACHPSGYMASNRHNIGKNLSIARFLLLITCHLRWWSDPDFKIGYKFFGSLLFVPSSLVYLQPPGARAIFLYNDLICTDTRSVSGGGGGAQTGQFFNFFFEWIEFWNQPPKMGGNYENISEDIQIEVFVHLSFTQIAATFVVFFG